MTLASIIAFLSLLSAFNVPKPTIDDIALILLPKEVPTITLVPVVQTPIIPNQPVQFGSVVPTVVQATPTLVIQSKPMTPEWTLEILVNSKTPLPDKLTISTKNQTGLALNVYNKDTGYQKRLITVTTDDPDLPATFTLNAPGQVGFFCIAPTYDGFPNNGCKNPNPVAKGTFNFTFTVEDIVRHAQIEVVDN